jgi:Restriction endonuclease
VKKADKPATSSRAKSDKGSAKSLKVPASVPSRPAKAGKAAPPEAKNSGKAAKGGVKVAVKKVAAKTEPKNEARNRKPKPAHGKLDAKGRTEVVVPVEILKPDLAVVEAAPIAPHSAEAAVATSPPQLAAAAAAPAMSDEERELSSLYQDDLATTSIAHGEFKDNKTADEDRPMSPEINARDERRRGWEDRRERRRQEREQRRARRDGGGHRGPAGAERPGAGPHRPGQERAAVNGSGAAALVERSARPERSPERVERNERVERAPAPSASAPIPIGTVGNGVTVAAAPPAANVETLALGTPMGAATATLYGQLRNVQPLPVRQLAGMLRKRGLIEGEPEQVWPQLRAELLADELAFRALGLRPRVVHRGRDLFAPGPAAGSPVEALEGQLVTSVASIQAATHRSLLAWMAAASPAAFERLIHAYLVAVSFRELQWVKRVDGISYAQATAPGIDRAVLISARSGAAPLDRRSIGELRVGVEAKGLPFGYLFSASGLSADAERELERPGRSIAVVCGDALVTVLMAAGIGVASTAVTVRFVDDQLLEDLSVG